MAPIDDRRGRGMILGKFLPPHVGHRYLVDFARQFAERLTVLVCTLERDPIPGRFRYVWMCEMFPDVDIVHVTEDLPQEPAEHPEFWSIWRRVVLDAVGEPIDYVFASESYGARLAEELNATFVPVDLARDALPISGTAIRCAPLAHWEFLPECVRPYFVKRVCLFGPESTGKSTLARDLARHFRTVHVPEFARAWLDPRGGVCEPADIPVIARGQHASEEALARSANRVLFCDTDLLLTTVWSRVLFDQVPQGLRQAALQRRYDLTLLLGIDVTWFDDGQRFLSDRRGEFFARCKEALEEARRKYIVISGDGPTRLTRACEAVAALLQPENGVP
jgi:NadR type nicotinamide-nucleotide adenylyltransferase